MRRISWRQLLELIRFLRDPRADATAKWVALAALFYLLWPLDLLPGLPPFSWLDDATVLWVAYQILSAQLDRYRLRTGDRPGPGDSGVAGDRRGPGGHGGAGGTGPAGRDDVIDARGRVK